MNILVLTDYYPPDKLGGVGEIAKHLYDEYQAHGHNVWVLTTGTSQSGSGIIRSSASLVKGIFLNNHKAIKLIRNEAIDVINLHQSSTTLFLLTKHLPFFYKKFPKVVNSFQVSYLSEFRHIKPVSVQGQTFRPTMNEYVEKWLFAPMHILLDFIGYIFADEITVVSTENKKEFERFYGRLSRKKIHVIPNGVDTEAFKPSEPKLTKPLLKQLEGKVVLLYVGVFRVRKRVFNLLFALARVVQNNSEVVLLLVGGGRDYEEEIMKLVKQLGITENVIFIGRVPNEKVVDYLNVSDVFCLLSSYEGMPIAILEAMASSTSILTSRASGMIDLISQGNDGYVTTVDDINDIITQLSLMVNEPRQTIAMGKNAREKTLKEYDWKIIVSQYLRLFEL